ncbi:MAG TPA: TIGR00645 family protein [Sphingomicrobium sp.]|nr:TIGR00645 family protein [Sphingomicrobium sp.]
MQQKLEIAFEQFLFAARWLAAPIYLGLVIALIVILVMLAKYVVIIIGHMPTANLHDAVIAILSLIDLALISNLVLIVLFTGYDSFISRLDVTDHEDRPAWLGKVDFSGLKLKLFASIVAITGIELLKAFMDVSEAGKANERALFWLVVIHVVFLVTTIGAAFSHWLALNSKNHS